MKTSDFNVTISVDKTPEEVFEAVNNVRGWWTENLEGSTQRINDEFEVRFGDVHFSRQKLVELFPGKKVVWLVTDSKLSFVKDKDEWTNTKIIFQITKKNGKTELRFTHEGLINDVECYDACSHAWTGYIKNSLRNLITTGHGLPEPKEKPVDKKTVA